MVGAQVERERATGSNNIGEAPACFIIDVMSRPLDGFTVCKACETTAGKGTIIGAQPWGRVFRIYPASSSARNCLLEKGVSIDGVHAAVLPSNPMMTGTTPSVRVLIGNIPLSVSNHDIYDSFSALEGVRVRSSRLFYECYREDDRTLSPFKTGRRFVYIDPPKLPLPKFFQVGQWRASLYYFGQKEHGSKETSKDSPADLSPGGVEARGGGAVSHGTPAMSDSAATPVVSPAQGDSPSTVEEERDTKNASSEELHGTKDVSQITRKTQVRLTTFLAR